MLWPIMPIIQDHQLFRLITTLKLLELFEESTIATSKMPRQANLTQKKRRVKRFPV